MKNATRCALTVDGSPCPDTAEHTRGDLQVCTGHAVEIDNQAADRKPEQRCQWDFSPLGDQFDEWRASLSDDMLLELYGETR